ncbi:MAG: ABC efflux pump, inner membrane subunit, putative ABC transport system permease protein [Candidatus Dadabacteria bacterium CSP1-2]|nr:MAG: ABC efflux pump, inner membrane subunit, putative ABC transport system permease protein [Candidatus Dadabacteria bacterium CSP1-2]
MVSVARRNLFNDKTRLAITLVGIMFAVVLMTAQIGAYMAFVSNASQLIDNSPADIWITAKNTVNVDSAKPFSENKINKVRETRGVLWIEKIAQTWGLMKLKSGGTESVQIIGFDTESGVGGPWRMKEGNIKDVKVGNSIIIDESSLRRLGVKLGDKVEIFDKQTEIVGISQGVRSFTTYPIAFTSYKTAKKFSRIMDYDQTTFVLVKLELGVNANEVVEKLREKMSGVDVYTKEQFSRKTRMYWSIQTGMGLGVGITVLLGFIVGTVVVGQTIYSSTMEHIREFGTLKAIGATNLDIYKIILQQAIINASIGYALGLLFTLLTKNLYERLGVVLILTPKLLISMFFITSIMCIISSFISIQKAAKVDPVIVFRA